MIPDIVLRNRAPIVLGLAGAASALLAVTVFPPQRELASLAELLVKLLPFLLAGEAIARLELHDEAGRVVGRMLLLACFLVFFTWFVPQIFFYLDQFEQVYVRMQALVPVIILTVVLAYRLGGASSSAARRLAIALLLIMLSGIEDLAFLTVNPHTDPEWATIPDTWTWADHIRVRIGHYPTKSEAYAFIAVHLLAAFAVLFVPTSWITRARTRVTVSEDRRHGVDVR